MFLCIKSFNLIPGIRSFVSLMQFFTLRTPDSAYWLFMARYAVECVILMSIVLAHSMYLSDVNWVPWSDMIFLMFLTFDHAKLTMAEIALFDVPPRLTSATYMKLSPFFSNS